MIIVCFREGQALFLCLYLSSARADKAVGGTLIICKGKKVIINLIKNTYFFAFSVEKSAADAGYGGMDGLCTSPVACKNCFLPEKSKEIFCKDILY